jgi:hypothetical protein
VEASSHSLSSVSTSTTERERCANLLAPGTPCPLRIWCHSLFASAQIRFLIMDPHYTGSDDLSMIRPKWEAFLSFVCLIWQPGTAPRQRVGVRSHSRYQRWALMGGAARCAGGSDGSRRIRSLTSALNSSTRTSATTCAFHSASAASSASHSCNAAGGKDKESQSRARGRLHTIARGASFSAEGRCEQDGYQPRVIAYAIQYSHTSQRR